MFLFIGFFSANSDKTLLPFLIYDPHKVSCYYCTNKFGKFCLMFSLKVGRENAINPPISRWQKNATVKLVQTEEEGQKNRMTWLQANCKWSRTYRVFKNEVGFLGASCFLLISAVFKTFCSIFGQLLVSFWSIFARLLLSFC